MHLVEIFLPLRDNEGRRFDADLYRSLGESLVERFGGLTAFGRAPAEGVWKDAAGRSQDEIIIFEVMVDALDRDWWARKRGELEQGFRQAEIVIRASRIDRL